MNRQTTRLLVPFYERDAWDKKQDTRDAEIRQKQYEIFVAHQNKLLEEKKVEVVDT